MTQYSSGLDHFIPSAKIPYSTSHQTAVASFSELFLLPVHTAATDIDFNDFLWVAGMMVHTDAYYYLYT